MLVEDLKHQCQIKFITAMLKSSPYDYSDANTLVNKNITFIGQSF